MIAVGMKLEAVDRLYPNLLCVATVVELDPGRPDSLKVNFDGWTAKFDYWAAAASADLRPIGWCEANGGKLQPPKGHTGGFDWAAYLQQTGAQPVPAAALAVVSAASEPPPSQSAIYDAMKDIRLDAAAASGPAETAAEPAGAPADLWSRLTLGLDARAQWRSTDQKGLDDQKLFAVDPSSVEHAEIAAEFNKTLPHLQVDSIERIENGYQHEQFSVHAKAVAASCGPAYDRNLMRRLLFHGTDAVGSIVNDMTSGFKPLLSGSVTGAIHGDGTCKHNGRAAIPGSRLPCRSPHFPPLPALPPFPHPQRRETASVSTR